MKLSSVLCHTHEVHNLYKGTGEASPVRGRDWAGFKFAAK
jgi:hypothetical protein